ncbi:hypothetical protein [Streptomyces bohaiensis]|uniref:Septum formation-related domain-containing protein n=1 Tax=Streptomyces bohaiensis TaxID=1431344 RepID=A0ABX1CDW4_9ACTN|nr:hypothetical protein [Streptomyces bohaiensis]NJQ16040.1 hypothetical protein [Streptomyces bohaiensis]
MRPITARTAHRRALTAAAGAVILAVTLTGCSGDGDAEPNGSTDASNGSDASNTQEGDGSTPSEELNDSGLRSELSEGDCWGRADTVDHDPVPCSEPHVFEVTGVHDDFVPSAPDDIITTTQEKEALCEETFAAYFGYGVDDQQPPVLSPAAEPTVLARGVPQTVVCSAYTTRTEEHTASFR